MSRNRSKNEPHLKYIVFNSHKQLKQNAVQYNKKVNENEPQKSNNKKPQKRQSKIKKISQLINNKNLCKKMEINLMPKVDPNSNQTGKQKKRKLDISLSKQKAQKTQSISELSSTKSTKIKLSSHRQQTIRKIKDFEISNQDKQNTSKAKTPRIIQNLQNCPNFITNCRQVKNRQNSNIININMQNFQGNYLSNQISKKKIKILRHR